MNAGVDPERGVLDLGEVVGGYRVEERLADGGVASVYRVRHVENGGVHALKVLLMAGPSDRERLLAEGRVQAHLRHPNIVAVSDVIEVNRLPALVLEYVAGPSLDRWLVRDGADLQRALALFRGVVAGVAAAHAAGLVHRDLKPANVLVDLSGREPVAKVTDFGLVRFAGDTAGPTRTGTSVGTPAYMAPEQIRSPSEVDARADLWSLGCLLYEMVCGCRAFRELDPFVLYERIANGRYVDPAEVRPDLPPRVLAAIRGLLVVDVAQRIGSCDALWEVLWDDRVPLASLDATPLMISGSRRAVPESPASAGPGRPWRLAAVFFGIFLMGAAAMVVGALALTLGVLRLTADWGVSPAAEDPPGDATVAPAPEVPAPVEGAPIEAPAPESPAREDVSDRVPPQPRPVAAPEPVPTGRVRVVPDGADVWLQRDGVRTSAGDAVPAGRYEVRAVWPDGKAWSGELEVDAGAGVEVRCADFVDACTIGRASPP